MWHISYNVFETFKKKGITLGEIVLLKTTETAKKCEYFLCHFTQYKAESYRTLQNDAVFFNTAYL